MKKKNVILYLFAVFSLTMMHGVYAQNVNIIGTVVDADTNKPISGASIVADGDVVETDASGKFEFSTTLELPILLTINFIGYKTESINITSPKTDLGTIKLISQALKIDDIVISASRVKESVMEASVSVETMDRRTIVNAASASFYDGAANLKGVQPNTGSMLFTSLNTRGFADPNNLRFVQLLDGASSVTPAFGVIGNTAGVSELDIEGMEILPGASSALYGADAFNGLLMMRTKDPFKSKGISLSTKAGYTIQKRGTNPYTQVAFRIADEIVKDKLAVKIDFETIQATDWRKVASGPRVTNIANWDKDNNYLNNNPVNNHRWDQNDRYGEADSTVDLKLANAAGTLVDTKVNRTGVAEKDILNPRVEHYKVNAGVYYKPFKGNNLEFSYLYKYSISDIVFRITTTYPFYDFEQLQNQFRIKNDWLTIRLYQNKNTANNAYAGRFAGKTIEQTLLPNAKWGELYTKAWDGNADGVASKNHYSARLYADSFMAQPGSPEYERAKQLALNTYAQAGTQGRFSPQSGAKLFEGSSYTHGDLNLDLSKFLDDKVGLQVGGSYRYYNLDSKGSFFNDGILGYNAPITYSQYGVYAQVSKKILDERLKATVSGRYSKRQELNGFVTPKASLVYSFGERKNHNLRASYQTGFRNPTAQEGYINYWVSPGAFVLGGLKENIQKFKFQKKDGSIVDAKTFFNNVTAVGAPNAPGKVSYDDALKGLKSEENTVYEIGYKGLWGGSFYLDASYAYSTFNNFIRNTFLFSGTPAGSGGVAIWYNNIDQVVSTHTVNIEGEYKFGSGYKMRMNWSFNELDAKNYVDAKAGNRAIDLRYNTPTQRLNTHFSNDDVYNGLGFNISHRINSGYDYKSSFGEAKIGSFNIIDAAVTKQLPKKVTVKLGGTNIFNEQYTFVYGGPNIGAMYYVSLRFDDIGRAFFKNKK